MTTLFRKVISLLLVASMLFSLGCEAFAETLTLPAALREIGNEAFYGDASLDEVVIPYGAESIGESAFADSGLRQIRIPETVGSIADSAFYGLSDDFTILAPANSYAWQYAIDRGYLRSDTAKEDLQSVLEQLKTLDFGEASEITIDEMTFDLIPTDGITDAGELALVQEYNACQTELAALNGEIIQQRDEIKSLLGEFNDFMEENQVSFSEEEGFSFNIEGLSFSIPAEVSDSLGSNWEMVRSASLSDGATLLELRTDNGTVYLRASEHGLSLADESLVEGAEFSPSDTGMLQAVSRVASSARNPIFAMLEPYRKTIQLIDQIINRLNTLLAMMSGDYEVLNARWARAYKSAANLKTSYGDRYSGLYETARKGYIQSSSALKGLKATGKMLGGLSLATSIYSLSCDLEDLYYLSEVDSHDHPSDAERQFSESVEVCRQLEDDLNRCVGFLMFKMGLTIYEIVAGVASLFASVSVIAGPAGWGVGMVSLVTTKAVEKAVRTLIVYVGNEVVTSSSNNLMQNVQSLDGMLHYALEGIVTDKYTRQPLENVLITCNAGDHDPMEVQSDAEGKFSLEPLGPKVSLRLHLSGHKDLSVTVADTLAYDSPLHQSFAMEPYDRYLIGNVTDLESGDDIIGAKVTLSTEDGDFTAYTDTEGYYFFLNPPVGTHTITFDAILHESRGPFTIIIDESSIRIYNARLRPFPENKPLDGTGFNSDFWQWCISKYDTYNIWDSASNTYRNDNMLDQFELAQVTSMDCRYQGFTSLYGIGSFRNLTYLDCSGNNLTYLDVSGCPMLQKLSCENNQLTGLNISGCAALQELSCHNNRLTNLNVSGCPALQKIDCVYNNLTSISIHSPNLTYLTCGNNALTNLNVSGCTALQTLYCPNGYLSSLDVSGCLMLNELSCFNNRLTSIKVSGSTALTGLWCYDNALTNLNVSGCTALQNLNCDYNQLESLDCSGCISLTELSYENNPLKSVNCSDCTSLSYFAFQAGMTDVDLSGCTALLSLGCFDMNQLISLDLSGCSSLTQLNILRTSLQNLNLNGCTALYNLECRDNRSLKNLDLSGLTALTELFFLQTNPLENLNCSGCTSLTSIPMISELKTLDVSGCTAVKELTTKENLESLNASGCTALEHLCIYGSPVRDLDISGCNALKELWCGNSALTALDVSNYSALEQLWCDGTPLQSLTVGALPALRDLSLRECRLKNLNLSGCVALEQLDCCSNLLSSLNLSGCTALSRLDCSSNQLTRLDLSGCPNLAAENTFCDANVVIVGR